MNEIKKAAVIGAGTMGSGIASHLANADIPVVMLDIVPDGADDLLAGNRHVHDLLGFDVFYEIGKGDRFGLAARAGALK